MLILMIMIYKTFSCCLRYAFTVGRIYIIHFFHFSWKPFCLGVQEKSSNNALRTILSGRLRVERKAVSDFC